MGLGFPLAIVCKTCSYFQGKLAWENNASTGFPAKWCLSNDCRKSILMTFTTQIWVVLLTGCRKFLLPHDQSEALCRSGWWHIISLELLQSLLKCHFPGNPVVTLRNISFFLRPKEESRTKELPSCSIPYLLVSYNTLERQLKFVSAHFLVFWYIQWRNTLSWVQCTIPTFLWIN